MQHFNPVWLLLVGVLVFYPGVDATGQEDPTSVPGMWGTTDTSHAEDIVFPDSWYGAHNLRAQWFKILAESPEAWRNSGYINHAKGEPPGNTYYIWRYDRPLPEGTRLLLEGDFPHARMMDIQVCAPWTDEQPPLGDGTGIPEIPLLDEDIVPDPGHTNPFIAGADRTAINRHFHVTLELRDGNPVELNPDVMTPPYRAPGNLRYGCTHSGQNGTLGPYITIRVYLPDHYDPFGGVEPPVLRIQLPGETPVLAPISPVMFTNLTRRLDPYTLEENPALESGFSIKELETLEFLRAYATNATNNTGQPGRYASEVHRYFTDEDGRLIFYKTFQAPYFISWLRRYYDDPEGCRAELPRLYGQFYGDLGPNSPPPGNDEHVSNHNLYNSYLVSAANLGPDQLLVFTGHAPQIPRTLSGDEVMGSSEQLRYWNITLQAGEPTRLTPVVNITDEDVALNDRGEYTIVIGQAEDRPLNATAANGVLWQDWPTGTVLSVMIRVMSTSTEPWVFAPQWVTWQEGDYCEAGQNPGALRERMSEYAFTGRYISRADFEAGR
jgi:hypothetical protein